MPKVRSLLAKRCKTSLTVSATERRSSLAIKTCSIIIGIPRDKKRSTTSFDKGALVESKLWNRSRLLVLVGNRWSNWHHHRCYVSANKRTPKRPVSFIYFPHSYHYPLPTTLLCIRIVFFLLFFLGVWGIDY